MSVQSEVLGPIAGGYRLTGHLPMSAQRVCISRAAETRVLPENMPWLAGGGGGMRAHGILRHNRRKLLPVLPRFGGQPYQAFLLTVVVSHIIICLD